MTWKTSDLCDACPQAQVCELGFVGFGRRRAVPRRADPGGRGEADVPLSFGGVLFTPGLRLVADDDGVIVLPAGVAEADLDIGAQVAATAACAGQR